MAKPKFIEIDVTETVTVSTASSNKTFFKGKATVSETDAKLIDREIKRLQEEREAIQDGEEDDLPGTYTKTALNKKSLEEVQKIAKEEFKLVFEENTGKSELVKMIIDAQ